MIFFVFIVTPEYTYWYKLAIMPEVSYFSYPL